MKASERDSYTVTSADGTRINLHVTGSGTPLILLHGLPGSSTSWHENGYVEDLASDFRVISLDSRGNGASDKPKSPPSYRFECVAADILAVADSCGIASFACIGSSWGANTALRLASSNERVTQVVSIGGAFGRAISEERLTTALAWWRSYIEVEREYLPEHLGVSARDFAELVHVDPLAIRAAAIALETWPIVEPEQISVPTLLIAGSEDHKVLTSLDSLRPRIARSKIKTCVLDGLGHRETFERSDLTLPLIRSFLTPD